MNEAEFREFAIRTFTRALAVVLDDNTDPLIVAGVLQTAIAFYENHGLPKSARVCRGRLSVMVN